MSRADPSVSSAQGCSLGEHGQRARREARHQLALEVGGRRTVAEQLGPGKAIVGLWPDQHEPPYLVVNLLDEVDRRVRLGG